MVRHKATARFIICLFTTVGLAQQVELLDLTNPPPQRERTSGGTAGGGAASTVGGPVRDTIPVRLRLISLNKTSYRLGEAAIYEIELENITSQPLVLPWSADYDRIKPSDSEFPRGYRTGTAGLRVIAASLDENISVNSAYGSDLVPASLKTLSPGQKVRIRASGTLFIPGASSKRQLQSQLPTDVDFRGSYWLQDSPIGGKFQPVVSDNSIRVRLN